MARRNFEDLLPRVLPYTPGCSDYQAIDAIRRAAREFFRDTLLWEHCVEVWLFPNVATYRIKVPTSVEIGHIQSVAYNGVPMPPFSQPELDKRRSGWRNRTAQSPLRWSHPSLGNIEFTPKPTEAEKSAINVYVRVYPAADAEYMDADLLNRWEEAIVDGALAELLAMPGQRFSNPDQAMYRQNRFNNKLSQGKAEYRKSGTNVDLTVIQRPMA